MGRIDDVLNVSGHRLSTIEIESALVSHPAVAEAAAVGRPHELKGEAVAVFVSLRGVEPNDSLRDELKQHVRKEIGALAQRTISVLRRRCRRPAAARSCVGYSEILQAAKRLWGTPQRWRTTRYLRSCGTRIELSGESIRVSLTSRYEHHEAILVHNTLILKSDLKSVSAEYGRIVV